MISNSVASAKWWSTGFVARHQLGQPVEQVLQPQHRADALVERVLVQDQGRHARYCSTRGSTDPARGPHQWHQSACTSARSTGGEVASPLYSTASAIAVAACAWPAGR
jgi:hypothetical protein